MNNKIQLINKVQGDFNICSNPKIDNKSLRDGTSINLNTSIKDLRVIKNTLINYIQLADEIQITIPPQINIIETIWNKFNKAHIKGHIDGYFEGEIIRNDIISIIKEHFNGL